MVSNNVIIVLVAMLIISTISTTYGVNMKHINSHHNKNHQVNSHANNHNKVAVGINSKAHANTATVYFDNFLYFQHLADKYFLVK